MPTDGTLKFDTKIDTDGFDKGTNNLNGKAKSAFKSIGGLAKNTFGAIGNLAKASTLAVGGMLGTIGAIGSKYNMEMESYITNFSTMLGSMDKATKLMKDMEKLASSTPLQMKGLASASQTLLAFEAVTEDNLIPTLRMLGDVALGDEQKLSSLALAFGQMSSTGKLMGQDLLQMINAGFNPLNEISKRTGESMTELKDRMSKGGISVEEVTQAFKDATSEGGKFYKAMENASKTAQGQMSTLKDNVSALSGELSKEFSTNLADNILPNVNDVVDRLLTATKENGKRGFAKVAIEIGKETLANIKSQIPQWIETGKELISNLADGLISRLPHIVERGKSIVISLIQGINERIPELIARGVDLINKLVSTFYKHLPQIIGFGWDIVKNIVKGIWDNIPNIRQGAIDIVKNFLQSIIENLPNIYEKGIEIVKEIGKGVLDYAHEAISWGKNIVTNILDGVKAKWGDLKSWLWDKATALKDSVLEKVTFGLYKGKKSIKAEPTPVAPTTNTSTALGGGYSTFHPLGGGPQGPMTININQPVKNPTETADTISNALKYYGMGG